MIVFSSISPPPMRGFVVRPFQNGEWVDDLPVFSTKRIPIVGVVVRSAYEELDGELFDSAEIIPVIHDPCYADALNGGMMIFDPRDSDDPAFSVVWCYWPESEDEERLSKIHRHVENEARVGFNRKKRQAQQRPENSD